MKVKFLVPEIDTARWAEKFKEELNIFKLKSKELSEIGAETICPQRINKYKNGAIPKIDTFLTICRFFTSSPDVILSANPKWIEYEINCKIEDFPPERVFGVFQDTYYIVPSYRVYERKHNFVALIIRRLLKEPNASRYSDFHFYGTEYDSYESVVKGKIIYQVELNGKKTEYKDKTKEMREYPVAILIDGNSASASEILASVIKESYNGYVVGVNSYGKGTVQQALTLSDGSMIKYTIENWLTPNGNSINEVGVEPTNYVELSDDYFNNPTKENDNQLKTAIDLLSN